MYKKIILAGLIVILITGIHKLNSARFNNYGTEINSAVNISVSDSVQNLINEKLQSMTLKEKIAQMVISSTIPENVKEGSSEFNKLKRLCEVHKIGGFIFFKGSSMDYVRLANKLQSYSETPLLMSADFERGTRMRVTDGSIFPNNMAIGAADNIELTYLMGKEIARETRLLGIHQNYAPVCDVNNNPNNPIINVRSFGEDPQLVSRLSAAMINGLQSGNVIATAKHFPGHGDTDIDSHSDLPVLNFNMERMNAIELVPFKNAIENKVGSVMIAHLSFPELEKSPRIPASLSQEIVKGLLIDKLKYEGLIVTDALNMKGITKYFSTAEVAVMCVKAGIDLILMPLDEVKTIDAIENAIKNGEISEERINYSAEKILSAKMKLGLFENKYVQEADIYKSINTSTAIELSQKIADQSITLVKESAKIFPIDKTKKTALVIISEGGEQDNIGYLTSAASDYFLNLNTYISTASKTDIELNDLEKFKNYDYIICAVFAKVRFGTGKISVSNKNIELIKNLNSLNNSIAVISLGNPYLLKEFPEVNSYICAYGDNDFSINAVLKAITGEIKFKGKLPVTINDEYKFGTGILK
jgi:beta-N-acetylhexosaminidase